MAEMGTSSVDSGYQSQSDLMVEAYKRAEQPKIDVYLDRKKVLEAQQAFYNSLYTKLNTLNNSIDTFTGETSAEKFVTRKVTTSDSSVLSVSSNSDSLLGINSVKVNNLASSDIFVSGRFDIADDADSIVKANSTSQDDNESNNENGKIKSLKASIYDFDIGVGDNAPVTVSVEFDGDETNEEALSKIVNAINNTDEISINASLIRDTETTARISFVSIETGRNNRISFNESAKGVLSMLGVDESDDQKAEGRTEFSASAAGYKTSNISDLDASFEINGIPITRGSNTISDALPGMTLTLLKPQDENELPITLNTAIDREEVETLIQPLLTNYNEVLRFFKLNKQILRTDTSANGLYLKMRSIISESIAQTNNDDLQYLTESGIVINSDGTIGIGDRDLLQKLLETEPEKVAHVFTSADSFTNKILNTISDYTGSEGLIKSRTLSLTDRIERAKDRADEVESRIDRESQALRKEYESMLRVYLEAQNQFSYLSSFQVDTSGYNSLLMGS